MAQLVARGVWDAEVASSSLVAPTIEVLFKLMTSTIRKPQKLDSDIPCECGFLLYEPIAEIGVSKLGLYNAARFADRCTLALDQEFSCANSRHIDSLDELSPGFGGEVRG